MRSGGCPDLLMLKTESWWVALLVSKTKSDSEKRDKTLEAILRVWGGKGWKEAIWSLGRILISGLKEVDGA